MKQIPETDWKRMRSMKDGILENTCNRIIGEFKRLIENTGIKAHDKYLQMWQRMEDADREIGSMFDDIKRSNALLKLSAWKCNGLISDDQLNEFGADTQEVVRNMERAKR